MPTYANGVLPHNRIWRAVPPPRAVGDEDWYPRRSRLVSDTHEGVVLRRVPGLVAPLALRQLPQAMLGCGCLKSGIRQEPYDGHFPAFVIRLDKQATTKPLPDITAAHLHDTKSAIFCRLCKMLDAETTGQATTLLMLET